MTFNWEWESTIGIGWLLLCFFVLSSGVFAEQREIALVDTAVSKKIDAIFSKFDRSESPGYAVGVIKGGKIVFARGYGRADLDHNVRITPKTAFHLAGLSYQFTGAAIALLMLEGSLTMETPVAEFFPEITKFGTNIRLKHLIYSTSGLPDYMSLPRPNGAPWFSFMYYTNADAIAATWQADRLKFAPGAQKEYSVINYILLAEIVERVSGMPLADFLQKRVFTPLGMEDTSLNDDSTLVIPNRATGYASRTDANVRQALKLMGVKVREGNGYVRLERISPHYGGTGVFSTIEDLAKWDENYYSSRLAGPAFTQKILQETKLQNGTGTEGFGLIFGQFEGREMIWFSGESLDASTFIGHLSVDHLTVIVLSNLLGGDAEGKAKEVLKLFVQ